MTTWAQLQRKIEVSLYPIMNILNSRTESYQWLSDAWNQEPNDSEVPNEVLNDVDQYIARRLNGEPWPYIIGFSWFMGYKFIAHQDATIPRENTQRIIDQALQMFDPDKPIRVADVGTGSGIMAITLALQTKWKITAVDTSAQALKIAEKNCNFHKVDDIELMVGNILTPLVRIPDLVVANLPSIDETIKTKLDASSLKDLSIEDSYTRMEPSIGVYAPENGNFWIKALLKQSYEWNIPVVIQQINNNKLELLEYAQSLGWHTGWITNELNNPVLITIRNG